MSWWDRRWMSWERNAPSSRGIETLKSSQRLSGMLPAFVLRRRWNWWQHYHKNIKLHIAPNKLQRRKKTDLFSQVKKGKTGILAWIEIPERATCKVAGNNHKHPLFFFFLLSFARATHLLQWHERVMTLKERVWPLTYISSLQAPSHHCVERNRGWGRD